MNTEKEPAKITPLHNQIKFPFKGHTHAFFT